MYRKQPEEWEEFINTQIENSGSQNSWPRQETSSKSLLMGSYWPIIADRSTFLILEIYSKIFTGSWKMKNLKLRLQKLLVIHQFMSHLAGPNWIADGVHLVLPLVPLHTTKLDPLSKMWMIARRESMWIVWLDFSRWVQMIFTLKQYLTPAGLSHPNSACFLPFFTSHTIALWEMRELVK